MDILVWIGKTIILLVIILLVQLYLIDPIINKIYEYRLKRKKEHEKDLKDKIESEVKRQLLITKKIS